VKALIIISVLTLAGIAWTANSTIQAMAANTWLSVPNSKIRPLCPSEASCSGITEIEGCGAVVWSWSGGAFDTKRNRMMVWGGGHTAYMGNEIYGFNVNTLTWSRITEPTCPQNNATCQDPLPDGNPAGRHTYDGLAYIEHADVFFACGGSLACTGGWSTSKVWAFDLTTNKWTNKNPTGTGPNTGFGYCWTCAYDPGTKKVFFRDNYGTLSYDINANAWANFNSDRHDYTDQTTAIDTKRHLIFTAGGSNSLNAPWYVGDIATKTNVTSQWTTTGGDALFTGGAPGLSYDPVTDNLIAVPAFGYTIYELNMTTKVWTQRATAAVVAPSEYHGGHYGRFRYSPIENAFVFVPSVDDNVWIYKHSAGTGVEARKAFLAATPLNITVMPNPISEKARIWVNGSQPKVSLEVFNLQGQRVTRLSPTRNGNISEASWNSEDVPAGIYLLKAFDGKASCVTRLLKQ